MQVEELDAMAQQIADVKEKKEEAGKVKAALEKEYDALTEKFIEALTESGKSGWKLAGVGDFSIRKSNYYKVTDYTSLRTYLNTNGLQDMLTVNSQTLRGWLNAGEWKPEFNAMFEQDPRTTISFTRSK